MNAETKNITVEGYLDIPDDSLVAVRAALPKHIKLTREEPGCLLFEVEFSTDIDGRLLVKETFVSQQAFEAHQTRMRASEWFEITDGLERAYTIR